MFFVDVAYHVPGARKFSLAVWAAVGCIDAAWWFSSSILEVNCLVHWGHALLWSQAYAAAVAVESFGGGENVRAYRTGQYFGGEIAGFG